MEIPEEEESGDTELDVFRDEDDRDYDDNGGGGDASLFAAAVDRRHRLAQARNLLYASRGLYYGPEHAWDFGSALWMAAVTGYSSLFWISAYQATARLMIIGLVPKLSEKIDLRNTNANNTTGGGGTKKNRWSLLAAWIVWQHACVMVTIVLIYGILRLRGGDDEDGIGVDVDVEDPAASLQTVGLVLICLFGSLAEVLHNVLEVAIERDWVVVLAEEAAKLPMTTTTATTGAEQHGLIEEEEKEEEHGEPSPQNDNNNNSSSSSNDDGKDNRWLQDTNVGLKQIYLACQIVAPLALGSLLSKGGFDASLWIVFAAKGISAVGVCLSMQQLYRWIPALQRPHQPGHDDTDDDENDPVDDTGSPAAAPPPPAGGGCCSDLAVYGSRHPLVGAGIGLALLYGNVLTFGGMMVAYLSEKGGMSMAAIGLWKGVNSGTAYFGTLWFSRSKLDVATKCLWSILGMFGCLTVSMVGLWLGSTTTGGSGDDDDDNDNRRAALGSALVIGGVLVSRIGLWGYDIGVTQLYQETVDPDLRGRVGGTQAVLNSALETLPVVLGMVFDDSADFWIIVCTGYACVGLALVSYTRGTYYHYYYECYQRDHSGGAPGAGGDGSPATAELVPHNRGVSSPPTPKRTGIGQLGGGRTVGYSMVDSTIDGAELEKE